MNTQNIKNTTVQPVDMTYRFAWDCEPTDEQLEQLMKEVATDVRQQTGRLDIQFQTNLRQGFFTPLQKEKWTNRDLSSLQVIAPVLCRIFPSGVESCRI
jgi:hypothetical protein